MIQMILVATDGSATSERAADFAASLAIRFHSKVTVLHALTTEPVTPVQGARAGRTTMNSLVEKNNLVDHAAGRLHELGVSSVETRVVEGPAVNVILGVAESLKPDLLVMGARGLSTWQGILLGSVSSAVTQRAECPVLIVK